MFFFTLHKNGIKKIAVAALCVAILTGSAIGISAIFSSDKSKEAATDMFTDKKVSGIEDISAFLANYNIICDPATSEVLSVKIPRKWDDSFRAFNEVIRESGLDLSKFKGKKVDKWVVLAPTLCSDTEKTSGVVLVYKGKAIGAYLIAKPSGEVSAIKMPNTAPAPLSSSEKAANASFGDAAQAPTDANIAAEDAPVEASAEEAMPSE